MLPGAVEYLSESVGAAALHGVGIGRLNALNFDL